MKVFRFFHGNRSIGDDSQGSGSSDKLISRIVDALMKRLLPLFKSGKLGITSGGSAKGSAPIDIKIDDSVVDVGVSTKGMELSSEEPLGKTDTEADNLSARDKLKALKDK